MNIRVAAYAVVLAGLLSACRMDADSARNLEALWNAGSAYGVIGGSEARPSTAEINDACLLLRTRPHWRAALARTYQRYGVPAHLVLAFIQRESGFNAEARPAKKQLPGLPAFHPSDAYGYAQAKRETWEWYQQKTGHHHAQRNRFADAADFIGWYVQTNQARSKLSKWDIEQQYLAYHEGMGGYEAGSYRSKPWLMEVARETADQGRRYHSQMMRGCKVH